jgi:ligand-binding sensor domain-containing protein
MSAWSRVVARAAARLALAHCLGAGSVAALDPGTALGQYRIQTWLVEHGLPQNTVAAIAQTPDGYLWLGTDEGLARFDGVRFAVFDPVNTPALRNAAIQSLLADSRGALWVGTSGGGVTRLADGHFETYGTTEGLPDNRVNAIYEDHAGRIWVGTFGGLRLFADGRFVDHVGPTPLPALPVTALREARDGALWIGTAGRGVWRWKDAQLAAVGDGPDGALAFHEDERARMWIGGRTGLWRAEGPHLAPVADYPGDRGASVAALCSDRDGSLWIGADDGLYRHREGRFEGFGRRRALPDRIVDACYEDREGALWVGTRAGLASLVDSRLVNYGTPEGLSADNLTAVHEDRSGGIWIGTEDGVVNFVAPGAREAAARKLVLPGAPDIRSLVRDARGVLWIGTHRGLARLQAGRLDVLTTRDGLLGDSIRSLLEDRDGSLWVAGNRGLNHITPSGIASYTTRDGLSSDQLTRLFQARDGALWIGTLSAGLNRLQDGRISRRALPGPSANSMVEGMSEDADGALWVATVGAGLVRLTGREAIAFTAHDGLPTSNLMEVVDDGRGSLWISSNKGILRLRKADLEAYARRRDGRLPHVVLGRADGMRDPECVGTVQPGGIRARDGRLWFPTIRGVVVVDPSRTATRAAVPLPVLVQELRANNHVLDLDGALELPRAARDSARSTCDDYLWRGHSVVCLLER